MNYNLIPVETVKAITGTTDNTVAAQQGAVIIGMLQNYLGLVLKKQDFTNEKQPVPYKFSRIVKTRFAPINSVDSLYLLTHQAEYVASTADLAIGRFTVELLHSLWSGLNYQVLPDAVSAVKINYNAGLYDTWEEVPAILQEAAKELLKFKYDEDYAAGYQSEHIGDYSYTKGNLVKGLPAEIAGMLDGIEL